MTLPSTLPGLLVFSPPLAGSGLAESRLLMSRLTGTDELASLQSWPIQSAFALSAFSIHHLYTLFFTHVDTRIHNTTHFMNLFFRYVLNVFK